MNPATRSGGCLCGGVQYEVAGPLRDVVVCHCSRCRHTHGHTSAYTACAATDLIVGEATSLRWYGADRRQRGFCGRCGASMFWQAEDRDTISIAAGTLHKPTGLRTIAQIHTADPGDYYELPREGHLYPEGLPPG